MNRSVEEVQIIDPNSPLLARVQARITEQLLATVDGLNLEIKEISENVKNTTADREKYGVDLYSKQQLLAKLQEDIDKYQETISTMQKIRDDIDTQSQQLHEISQQRKTELQQTEKKYEKYKEELSRLGEKIIQIEQYSQSILDNIALKRRQTFKTEEEMTKLEKEKKTQDFLIDKLTQQTNLLYSQIANLDIQINQQKTETKKAQDILAEALTEIDAIKFEKKQLQQQWNSSLIGMQRRDEALQIAEEQLSKIKERTKEVENEIEGYKNSISKEKENNENLTQQSQKLTNDKLMIERQIEDFKQVLENKQSQYSMLMKTLEQTEEQLKKQETQSKILQGQIATLNGQQVHLNNDLKQLEDERLAIISNQITYKKGSQSTVQALEKLMNKIRDKELDLSNLENEIARTNMDIIETQNHNKQLKSILEDVESEIKSKDELVTKYQLEIKRKHDEIEKRQATLDKLNKQFEKLTSGGEEESLGPLEATIKNISKQIEGQTKESELLKKSWIKAQSELVDIIQKIEETNSVLRDTKSKQTVLTQKRMRLDAILDSELIEIKQMTGSMNIMHQDMTKLNSLISKNSDLQKVVADINFDLENQILDSLKNREREALNLEGSIKSSRDEKRRLLSDLVEVQRQIMYWEKKIEIQKEIQETLNPDFGQDEISKMTREIHLMEQKLEELKRNQKKKIQDMEKALTKRELIINKGKAITQNVAKGGETRGNLQREITHLSRQVENKKKEAAKYFQDIKSAQKEGLEIVQQIEDIRTAVNQKQAEAESFKKIIQLKQIEKAKVLEDKERLKQMHTKYDSIRQGSYKLLKDADIDALTADHSSKSNAILETIAALAKQFPSMAQELDVVKSIFVS